MIGNLIVKNLRLLEREKLNSAAKQATESLFL